MLKDAPYVVIPVFKCKELNGKYVSKLISGGNGRGTGLLHADTAERGA